MAEVSSPVLVSPANTKEKRPALLAGKRPLGVRDGAGMAQW